MAQEYIGPDAASVSAAIKLDERARAQGSGAREESELRQTASKPVRGKWSAQQVQSAQAILEARNEEKIRHK